MSTTNRLRLCTSFIAVFMLLIQFFAVYEGLPGALRGKSGFRSLYLAAFMVRIGDGRKIYDHESTQGFQNQLVSQEDKALTFDHAAYETLIFVPLSILHYRTAYLAFFVLNLTFLGLAIWLLRPYLGKLAEVWSWAPFGVFICFLPVVLALIQGEDSIFLLTLLVASAVCFYRNLDLRAGMLLGLTLFQLQISIPIALLFLLWRRWRILAGFCIAAVADLLASVWILGPVGFKIYLQLMLQSWNSQLWLPSEGMRGSAHSAAIPDLRCLLNALASHFLSPTSLTLLLVCFSSLMILWAATKPANFALAILVAVLVSSRGRLSDAAVLVVPIAMVLDSRLAATSGRLRLWSRNIVCLLFVAPSLLFLAGRGYCWLVLPMLLLLLPLRSTSDSPPPANNWFNLPARFRVG
jgi:hypothetical protein